MKNLNSKQVNFLKFFVLLKFRAVLRLKLCQHQNITKFSQS